MQMHKSVVSGTMTVIMPLIAPSLADNCGVSRYVVAPPGVPMGDYSPWGSAGKLVPLGFCWTMWFPLGFWGTIVAGLLRGACEMGDGL